MKMKRSAKLLLLAVTIATLSAGPARSNLSSSYFFGDQPSGPNSFAGSPSAQQITFNAGDGIETFTNGAILTNELNPLNTGTLAAQLGNVYATSSSDVNLSNQLTLTLSQPVSGANLWIVNNFAGTYELYDGLGHSATISLPANQDTGTLQPLNLSNLSGVTTLFVSDVVGPDQTLNTSWNFAIDRISFTPVPVPEPEPITLALFGVTLGGFMIALRRRRHETEF